MAYVDERTNSGKLGTGIAVAAVHVGIGAALLTTFAGGAIKEAVDNALTANNWIDVPPPPPQPTTAPSAKPTDNKIVVPPVDNGLGLKDSMLDTTIKIGPIKPLDPVGGLGGDVIAEPTPFASPSPRYSPVRAAPRGQPGLWVTRDDYPARAIREEWTGVTRFQLTIGTDGRVTGCTVTAGSGHEELDRVACDKVSARAKFNPAKDETGAATAGTYESAIRWQIE